MSVDPAAAVLGGLLLWAANGLAAATVAELRVLRAARRPLPAPPATEGIALLLRPCAGAEPGLAARLSGATGLRAPLAVHHRFVVASAEDDAVPAIEEAVAALRAAGHRADWMVGPPLGPNRKVSQLHAGATAPLPDEAAVAVVLNADSDVDLAGVDLGPLLLPLLAPDGPAATWAAPTEPTPGPGLGDRLSQALLAGSMHAFPLLRGVDPAGLVGKCFAVRPDALGAVGGFSGLAHHLGEDMELSRRLRAAGWTVDFAPLVVPSRARGRRALDVVARFARWMQVIRAQRPVLLLSYPLLFAPLPWQLLLAGVVAALSPGSRGGALLVAGACLAARMGVAAFARRSSGTPTGPVGLLLDVVLAEAALTVALVRVLLSRRFHWRGNPLQIGPGGRLQADPSEAAGGR